jgi:hypothetical protein
MSISQEDPRAPRLVTWRNAMIALAILLLGIGLTAASVYLRQPQLEKTRRFLGDSALRALQLGSVFEVGLWAEPDNGASVKSLDGGEILWTDLSDSPGVAMFRRALLDERHYDWSSQREEGVSAVAVAEPQYALVRVSGEIPKTAVSRREPIEPQLFLIELSEGWMGRWQQPGAVQFTDRVRPAVRNFVLTRRDARPETSR